jgi:hypothetical protein
MIHPELMVYKKPSGREKSAITYSAKAPLSGRLCTNEWQQSIITMAMLCFPALYA